MELENFIRFGYILMVTTILLMIWASLIGAREIESIKYPPCTFNPLCTCSKPAPDLGIVQCRHVPFPAIPKTVNISKVFMLEMKNTGLLELEPYFLQATGLYRLEISYNPLTEIPDDAFIGLERSIWELMLQHNELIDVPSRAIRHLQKLRHLDLSGNYISCIEPESFRGLEDSLQTLILAENSINTIPADGFATLPMLDTIDLSGNNIAKIEPNIFRDGMPRLTKLLMSDNILTEIPYVALAPLKQLRTLDLSKNLIHEMIPFDSDEPRAIVGLTLDNLHLEYNLIEMLPTGSFQNFAIVNKTYLDGNPLAVIGEEAFRPTKIRELYIRQCKLHFVSPIAFEGLGASIQILDLSGNNITSLPENIFNNFDVFRVFNLKDNKIHQLWSPEAFNGFQFTLFKLDISGENNVAINLQDLRRLRNVRSLSISRLSSTTLSPDDFLEYGLELEDLKVTRGSLKTIKSHAFTHIRGIKRLDLSDNKINQFEPDAFTEIGHSLLSLKASNALAGSVNSIPTDIMRPLTSLQELDLSNNQIKTMSDTCFHFLKNLRVLALQDNRIEQVLKGTFQGDIHTKMEYISLSFNNLKHLTQHAFVDLEALQRLHLDDNRIEHIERRAFMNLDQLKYLSLRGNKLTAISDEAFQVYDGDSLPRHICQECIADVNKYYDKIQSFNRLERQWHSKLKQHDLSNHYFQVSKIVEIYSSKVRNRIEEISPKQPLILKNNILAARDGERGSNILKDLLLNRHIYKVKTLQQLCIDYFNTEGPDLLDTVLKIREPTGDDDDDDYDETEEIDYSDYLNTKMKSDGFKFTSINPYAVKKGKKKKKRNPLRDYITQRRKKKNSHFVRQNIRSIEVASNVTNGEEKERIESTNGQQAPLKIKRKYKKRIWNINPINLQQELHLSEDGQTLTDDQSRLSLAFLKTVTPDNIIMSGKRPRNRPIRLSDQIHVKSIEKKQAKMIEKIEKRKVKTFDKIDPSTSASPVKNTPLDVDVPIKKSKLPTNTQTKELTQKKPVKECQQDLLPIKKEKIKVENNEKSNESTDGNENKSEMKEKQIDTLNISLKRSSASPSNVSRKSAASPIVTAEIKKAPDELIKSTEKPENACEESKTGEKSKKSKVSDDTTKNVAATNSKPRAKARINYSEALVDEALMYEEILMDKEAKEQLVIATALEASKQTAKKGKNDFSFDFDDTPPSLKKEKKLSIESHSNTLSEISITPISKPNTNKTNLVVNPINVSVNELKNTFKSNPEMVLNINSAVSIQLKSPVKAESSENVIADSGSNIVTCSLCGKINSNINSLAIHQLEHLSIQTHRIGEIKILEPKYRRGRMVPMGIQKCFRCLNCWRLHPNSQSILEHWVRGKCLFYCTICGDSFHLNPKHLREHFPDVHGIKYKLPEEFLSKEIEFNQLTNGMRRKPQILIKNERAMPKLKPFIQKSGRVTCAICSCSFPNMQSRNSHMRLHKNEKIPNRPFTMQRMNNAVPNAIRQPLPNRPPPPQHGQQGAVMRANMIRASHPGGTNIRPGPLSVTRGNQPPLMRINQTTIVRRPIPHGQSIRVNPSHANQHQIAPRNAVAYQRFKMQPPKQMPRLPSEVPMPMTSSNSINYSPINVKTEITEDDPYSEYGGQSGDFSSTDFNSVDYSSDYMDDYSNMLPIQPEVIMNQSIKSEFNTMPRLQVKKLHELQEPNYASSTSTYYPPNPMPQHHQPQHPQQQQQQQQHPQTPVTQYQMAPQHLLQMPGQMQPIQLHQQPQFQISQAQQVQNTQYYNPVFVVQPPQQTAQPPQHDMYQYNSDQMDYGKYYS